MAAEAAAVPTSGARTGAVAAPVIAPKRPVTLDPAATIAEIERIVALRDRVRRMLAPIPQVQQLIYEEMFAPDGRFSETALAVARRAMRCADLDPVPSRLRQNPEPLDVLIANAAEVRAALEGTPHGWMMDAP
jgi:hypothetical protein